MKQNIRILALTLSAVLALGSTPAFAAEPGRDAPLVPMVREYDGRFVDLNNAWCADAAAACFSAKLMEGRQANRFDAASPLTQAQIIVICARLHNLLTGGDGVLPAPAEGEPWYQSAYRQLETLAQAQSDPWRANALMPWEQMEYYANTGCQRSTFSALILLVLDSVGAEFPVINDLNQATPDLKPDSELYSLYRWGIVNGMDAYGSFRSGESLNRGQAAAILARVVDPAQRLRFTLKPFDQCRDVLDLPKDTLLLTIDGRAYSAEDCAEALCQGLRQEVNRLITDGQFDPDRVLNHMENAMKLAAATEQLAQQEGITVSDDELTEAYGTVYAGYQGRTESASHALNHHHLLSSKLTKIYEARYGTQSDGVSPGAASKGREQLDHALQQLCAGMSVQQGAALQKFDVRAAAKRMQAGPL